MENKLNRANENINELVDRLVSAEIAPYTHCCLKVILFNESRSNCSGECSGCNNEVIERYTEMLLEKYLVK